VVFGASPPPKIPGEVIASLQAALINLRTEGVPPNPFIRTGNNNSNKSGLTSKTRQQQQPQESKLNATLTAETASTSLASSRSILGVESTHSVSSINPESRVVLRVLVSVRIRKLAEDIISLYRPFIEGDEGSLLLDDQGTAGFTKDDEGKRIAKGLAEISSLLGKLKSEDDSLGKEIKELKMEIECEKDELECNLKEVLLSIFIKTTGMFVRVNIYVECRDSFATWGIGEGRKTDGQSCQLS
jgi:hypothetical protein